MHQTLREDATDGVEINNSDALIDSNDEASESDSHESTERHDKEREMKSWKGSSTSMLNSENNKHKISSDEFVEYEVASSRGRAKGLWSLAGLTSTEMKEMEQPNFEECLSFNEEDYTAQADDSFRDRILSMKENDGLDILMNLFGDINNDNDGLGDEKCVPKNATAEPEYNDKLPLSPRGRELCISIKSSILRDTEKMKTIQKACPHWEENISFAFHQGADELRDALCNVREKRSRLKKAKEMLESIVKKDIVLDLFESVITKSLDRYSFKSDSPL